jgi:hypothetical protein
MNRAVIVTVALFFGIEVMGQEFEKDTLVYNGNSDKHINLVILGDGYTNSELSKFEVDAANFTTVFFNLPPYSYYKKYFNVFIVKVPSNQSGASHPGTATDVAEPVIPVITVDNYFGSTFDYYQIHRLLVATKTSAISNVLAANFPNYDQTMILVNSPYYGGSGGYYTVASTHSQSSQIAVHELGHSFAGLKDEYWAGDIYAGEGINMTQQTDPLLVRWKNWIGINLIGIYQHCCGGLSEEWYKPHQNCLMQFLGVPFCSVCVQATIERIHSLAPPVESYYPPIDVYYLQDHEIALTTYPIKFKLNLIAPEPNTLKRNWLLNNLFFKHNIDSVSINENNLRRGINTLNVTVEDTTQLLRVDNHASIHISSVTWSINKEVTGIKDITSTSSEIIIDLYPNPTSDFINIKLLGDTGGKINLAVYDMLGKKVKVYSLHADEINSIDLHDLNKGIYVAKIYVNDNLITSRKIIMK